MSSGIQSPGVGKTPLKPSPKLSETMPPEKDFATMVNSPQNIIGERVKELEVMFKYLAEQNKDSTESLAALSAKVDSLVEAVHELRLLSERREHQIEALHKSFIFERVGYFVSGVVGTVAILATPIFNWASENWSFISKFFQSKN